jgi:CHASE2 domain-containing sensor protein
MTRTILLWGARFFGIALTAFFAVFALDAFEPGKPLPRALIDFAVHLIPAGVAGAALAVAWREPWFGGLAFAALACIYAAMIGFRLDWTIAIAGPLLAAGLLFVAVGWMQKRVVARR